MPTPTYIPLATVTLGSSASSVTFSSIPTSGYRDLVVVFRGSGTSVGSLGQIKFNSDTGANYSRVDMRGDSGGTGSGTGGDSFFANVSTSQADAIIQIMDYSATDKHKTFISRSGIDGSVVRAWCVRWANTAAITTVALSTSAGSYATGTTVALYGIAS